ncbi:class I SAM-dependent methyltransferase [Candidatus Pacearchaeota archaeon]|nr:class I SAM-dependent methyltransferase [Candidatus Pacearchaeota archaeon]
MEKFLEKKECEICGNNSFKIIYSWSSEYYSHKKFETCSWDGRKKIPLQIVKCRNCGLVFSLPSFRENFLNTVYPEDFVSKSESSVDEFFYNNDKKSLSLIRKISKIKKDGVLLDIGTRYGSLPWVAKKNGFESYGIDLNKKSIEIGRKRFKNIYNGTINDIQKLINEKKIKNPEIIVMDDVLEHLVHPLQNLKTLAKIQRKNDLLVLRQMDYGCIGRKIFGKHWHYLQPAAHQFYFDWKSIGNLLEKSGYNIVFIRNEKSLRPLLSSIKSILTNIVKSNGNKKLYLVNRPRAWSDIFLVIALKK